MAHKTLTGLVVSTKMMGSVVVEVTRRMPHPMYKKLITTTKRYVADSRGVEVKDGDSVAMVETRKMAGNKHFKVVPTTKKEGKTK